VSRDDNEEIESELAENDGLRPDEDEGPDKSEASPRRCEFRQGERTAGVGESSFGPDEELHESFPVEPIPTVLGADGMPAFIEPDPSDTQAIPFTWETQLCIGDDREYVEIFGQELPGRGWVPLADDADEFDDGDLVDDDDRLMWLSPDGDPIAIDFLSRYSPDGTERVRRTFKPEEVEHLWGVALVRGAPGCWLPVRPRREPCKHYCRQVFSNDSQKDPALPGHQIVFRVCKARRSNGGAYMSLSNEAVYACDFRDPHDEVSTGLQDKKDRHKLVNRPDLLKLPLFNMPGDAVQLENKVS
jgi:hypothetical protein